MSQPFNSPLGNSAYTSTRPAAAVRAASCSWWKQRLGELAKRVETSAAEYREAVKQFKESGVWEDEYDSWEEAAQECLGITKQTADRLVRELYLYAPGSANFLIEPQKPERVEKTVFENLGKMDSETVSNSKVVEPPRSTKSTLLPPKTADEWEKKEQFAANPKTAEEEVAGPPKDDLGQVIPQRCLEVWNRRDELQKVLSAASDVQAVMKRLTAQDNGQHDLLYAQLYGNLQSALEHAHHLYHWLDRCKPARVCPKCKGKGGSCDPCKGVGLVSKYVWKYDIVNGTDPYLSDAAKKIEG